MKGRDLHKDGDGSAHGTLPVSAQSVLLIIFCAQVGVLRLQQQKLLLQGRRTCVGARLTFVCETDPIEFGQVVGFASV